MISIHSSFANPINSLEPPANYGFLISFVYPGKEAVRHPALSESNFASSYF